MAIELVTGRAGTPHISSADDRAYNAYTDGDGRYLLHGGGCTMQSANDAHLAPAEFLLDGAHVRITGLGEDVTIDNGASSYKRIDVIALHYSSTGSGETIVETMALEVVKGTPADSDPVEPDMPSTGSLLDGVTDTYIPLYRIAIDGLTPGTPELMLDEYSGMIPGGGNKGYVLQKASDEDGDAEWARPWVYEDSDGMVKMDWTSGGVGGRVLKQLWKGTLSTGGSVTIPELPYYNAFAIEISDGSRFAMVRKSNGTQMNGIGGATSSQTSGAKSSWIHQFSIALSGTKFTATAIRELYLEGTTIDTSSTTTVKITGVYGLL